MSKFGEEKNKWKTLQYELWELIADLKKDEIVYQSET